MRQLHTLNRLTLGIVLRKIQFRLLAISRVNSSLNASSPFVKQQQSTVIDEIVNNRKSRPFCTYVCGFCMIGRLSEVLGSLRFAVLFLSFVDVFDAEDVEDLSLLERRR